MFFFINIPLYLYKVQVNGWKGTLKKYKPFVSIDYYETYNNKNAIINANRPVASAKAKPNIA